MKNKNPLRIAIIGYGAVAKASHRKYMSRVAELKLEAIVENNGNDEEIDGIRVYKNLEEAQSNGVIDAVSICTPPDTHAEIARDALNRGCHVLLEKPPVIKVKDLDVLEGLAKEKGKVLFLAYHTASSPAVYELQKLLESKKVIQIDANFSEQVTKWHNPDEWIFKKDESGGGVTRDIGINVISAICKTLPNANFRLLDSKLEYEENYTVDTKALIHLEDTVTGTKVTINLDWFNGVENEDIRKIKYTTDSGVYVLDLSTARLFEEIEGEDKEIETDRAQEYEMLYKEFVAAVERGESYIPHREADLMEAIYLQNKLETEGKLPLS